MHVNTGSLQFRRQTITQKMINGIASVWIKSCMRSRVQTEAERRRREVGVEQSMKIRYRYVRVCNCIVFGIISRAKERSETNEVPKCRSLERALLRHHYNFLSEVTRPILRMRSRYLVISPILMGRFGSNLLFGTSCYVSDTQASSDSCNACTY